MMTHIACAVAGLLIAASASQAQTATPKQRAREMGLSAVIGGTPGRSMPSPTLPGSRSVTPRSSPATAGSRSARARFAPASPSCIPRGKTSNDPVFAAWFTLNGNGEMTGTTWIGESGFLEGPIGITNTHSVGVVRDAIHRSGR